MDHLRKCPECGANWVAGEMTEEQKEVYAGTFFSRLIGIYDMDRDRTVAWECPDCKTRWPR